MSRQCDSKPTLMTVVKLLETYCTSPLRCLIKMNKRLSALHIVIIIKIIFAFRLVLAYDLLEDRRTIDVIKTKLFPRLFYNGGKF